ncbi:MAG: hypothetical protein HFI91_01580 [Lachnospiraceae bacterium]|nr:hypothetical protein [Lachnospiraceae bacterium]
MQEPETGMGVSGSCLSVPCRSIYNHCYGFRWFGRMMKCGYGAAGICIPAI